MNPYKLLSFICYKCGCNITGKNFHSSRQCKQCHVGSKKLSLKKSGKKWRTHNKAEHREATYDCREKKPFKDAERFIELYKNYKPLRILNER